MSWINSGGKSVLKQSQKQSCGYCCIGMVLNLIDPHRPKNSESSLVAEGKRLDPTAYDRAAMDRVGARPTPIIHAAYEQHHEIPHWGSGTYGNHLAEVLRSYRIDGKYIPPYNAQGGTFANYFVTVSGRLTTPRGVKLPGM